ncbi:hypothetical protein AJ80_01372 [Polytolypa hystricis UAMH7299]|uniref:N-acetyltransferase domain-containing protein n=1 Tax=Polytolypa hystricis (strain UAMH7299) TaxID=1447883 RepID=A0A2B7Z1I5_POLH7|nr:hypothetical protein AJ80_01372 [Polytolypa hystricis UAMH7299]
MKRPAKLRELRLGGGGGAQHSLLSRFAIFQSSDKALQALDVGDQIPGMRIPVAFLSSLRANLQISSSSEDLYLASPSLPAINTPDFSRSLPYYPHDNIFRSNGPATYDSGRTPAATFTPYALSSVESGPYHDFQSEVEDTPPLTTAPARTDDEILTALDLIKESVSQQRQIAAKCIIFHPAVVATSIIIFLTITKLVYTGHLRDLLLMTALWTTCTLISMLAIRFMVREYTSLAPSIGSWSWLSESSVNGVSHKRDEIFVTKYNDEIVGVLVLRIAKTVTGAGTPGTRPRSARRKSSARWTGIVRAWTIKQGYRHQGIGTNLLGEAVSSCRLRALDGPLFADDHAHSKQVLPGMFNSQFQQHDRWARGFLERVIIERRER